MCDNGLRDIFAEGEFGDFKSYCLFLAVYIPAIIHDHFVSYRGDGVPVDHLVLDIVTKPSNWKRYYEGSPCDHVTPDGRHVHVDKTGDHTGDVSCRINFLKCVAEVVQEYVDNYTYLEGEIKPLVRFSIAFQEQTIDIQYDGPNKSIISKKIDDISGIDDILAIKKVMAYNETFPEADIRLVTCDTMKSNILDRVSLGQNGQLKTKSVPLEEYTIGNYRQHTVTLPIKSPVVDIAEVFFYAGEAGSSLYSHSSREFWDGISKLSIKGVLWSPFAHWNPPKVSILRCLYEQSSCKDIKIRRKNPLSSRKCTDETQREYFVSSQIVLSAQRAQQITYGDGIIQTIVEDPESMEAMNDCIRMFNNKSCDTETMLEFKSLMDRYMVTF